MTETLKNYNVTIDTESHSDRIPAPAKRWKNMFKVKRYYQDIRGVDHFPEEIGHQPNIFPSKETAEQGAIDYEIKHFSGVYSGAVKYLGAFPE